jgi:hypothetical protein
MVFAQLIIQHEIKSVISKSVCGCEMCATDTWNMQLDTHASIAMYQVYNNPNLPS